MPTAIALRHIAFEDLGTLTPALAARGFDVRYLDAGVDDVRDVAACDLAVILGGPIGAYEEDRYPFLIDEMRVIEARLAAGLPTLGICLGAQLMARALGARVYPGTQKEIGWSPLRLSAAGARSPLRALGNPTAPVLHWHGDTFDLPAGAELLASTEITQNQAFAHGRHALALQFHIEAEPAKLERWLIGHTMELTAAGIDIAALRRDTARHGPPLQSLTAQVLNEWLSPSP
ncbi:MAG: glutamine amidotransferase [Proteobacteria bacterium]|nr:MAG: glutamine amidotransferase [Pseudomonadota bacterium]